MSSMASGYPGPAAGRRAPPLLVLRGIPGVVLLLLVALPLVRRPPGPRPPRGGGGVPPPPPRRAGPVPGAALRGAAPRRRPALPARGQGRLRLRPRAGRGDRARDRRTARRAPGRRRRGHLRRGRHGRPDRPCQGDD